MIWFAWTLVVGVYRLAEGIERSVRGAELPIVPVRIDVNRAPVAELRLLPGFGPVRARAVVLERLRNGYYGEPAELLRVPGVGPATVRDIAPWIRTGR